MDVCFTSWTLRWLQFNVKKNKIDVNIGYGTVVFFVGELPVLVPNCIDNLRAAPPSFILRLKVMNSLILLPLYSRPPYTYRIVDIHRVFWDTLYVFIEIRGNAQNEILQSSHNLKKKSTNFLLKSKT